MWNLFILFPQQHISTELVFFVDKEVCRQQLKVKRNFRKKNKALLCSCLRWLPWPGWKGTGLFAVKSCFIIPEPLCIDKAWNGLIVLASAALLTDSTIHTSSTQPRACDQRFPQAHGENKVPHFTRVERQWRGRLCAHRPEAHSF